MVTRDISKRQFLAALKRHGMTPQGFLGYVEVLPGRLASILNAGTRRRDQLAYLLRCRDDWERERRN